MADADKSFNDKPSNSDPAGDKEGETTANIEVDSTEQTKQQQTASKHTRETSMYKFEVRFAKKATEYNPMIDFET